MHASREGRAWTIDCDRAVHAGGRKPDLDALALDRAGIDRDAKGALDLLPSLRSRSNDAVWAAGDAAQRGPALTPVATIDAKTVAANLLDDGDREPDYTGVASVVFTVPPLASVGLSADAATKQGLRFDCREGDMAEFQSVRRVREDAAAYRVLVERDTDRILGAHLLGPNAEEVITVFAAAIRFGATASALADLPTGYPSFSSNISSMLG